MIVLFAALFYVFEVYPIIKLVQLIREDLRDGAKNPVSGIVVID